MGMRYKLIRSARALEFIQRYGFFPDHVYQIIVSDTKFGGKQAIIKDETTAKYISHPYNEDAIPGGGWRDDITSLYFEISHEQFNNKLDDLLTND